MAHQGCSGARGRPRCRRRIASRPSDALSSLEEPSTDGPVSRPIHRLESVTIAGGLTQFGGHPDNSGIP
jgi:hypothetical protein